MKYGLPNESDNATKSFKGTDHEIASFGTKVEKYQKDDIAKASFNPPTPDKKNKYPDAFFKIIFHISSEEFTVDVQSILRLKNEKGNFEVRDGILALERISGIRQILISAMKETYISLQISKDALEVWEAENKQWAEEEIVKKRKLEIKAKFRKEIGQITNDQKMSLIFSDKSRKAEFLGMKDENTRLQALYNTLDRTCDNLFNRGIHLLRILNAEGKSEGYQIK